MLDPVELAFKLDWQKRHPEVSESDVARIRSQGAGVFYEIFSSALTLNNGYPAHEDAGADVLRVTASITELDVAATPGTVGNQRMYVVSPSDLTLFMELRDSTTWRAAGACHRSGEGPRGRQPAGRRCRGKLCRSEARARIVGGPAAECARRCPERRAGAVVETPVQSSNYCMRNQKMKRSIFLAIIGVLTTIGCATAKEPFAKEDTVEATATIEAIDTENRLLSIRGPGGPATLLAGPEVRNFAQIHVGDQVKVTYTAAVGAAITKSKATPTTTYDSAAIAAPIGAKPAAAVGATVSTTVQIESVDTSFDAVTFKRPDGFVRTIAVSSPEAKKFIRTLKKGDMVDVTYTEALAISVVPAK